MQRTFVMVRVFDRKWDLAGLGDDSLRELQMALLANPEEGEVIQGTHGVRKMRWALPGRGKSGGIRIFYVDFPQFEVLYLLTLLEKSEKANLDRSERHGLGDLVMALERTLKASTAGGRRK